jgi:hypothetical protein
LQYIQRGRIAATRSQNVVVDYFENWGFLLCKSRRQHRQTRVENAMIDVQPYIVGGLQILDHFPTDAQRAAAIVNDDVRL